ncbi:MAG: HDOD domain-containing protein [Hydrogenovibrio sp.]|jgi:HD-like signal output (HDOD) protein
MSLKDQVDVARQLLANYPVVTIPREVMELRKLLDLYEFPNPSKIKELVSTSPTLAGDLVALANKLSQKKPQPKSIQSIDAAIDFLGLKNIKHYVFCVQIQKMLDASPVQGLSYHSIVIADILVQLTKKLNLLNTAEAYMFGLVHDIGTFLFAELDKLHPETFVASLMNHYQVHQDEYARFGTTHSAVGYVMTKDWGLKDEVCKAILLHHEDDLKRIKDKDIRQLTAMLELAHVLALENKKNILETELPVLYEDTIQVLALTEDDVNQIRRQVHP